jgi:hypothetical protein
MRFDMDLIATALIAALVKKIVDTLVFVFVGDWIAGAKQLVAWAVGFASLWLVGSTPWGAEFSIGGQDLGFLGITPEER